MNDKVRLTRGAEELLMDQCEEITTVKTKETAKATLDYVREALEVSASTLTKLGDAVREMEAFKDAQKNYMADLRNLRIGVTHEIGTITRELADLRKFLLDDRHQSEVARLKEFIELCERLKALKESGFLDAVADTMLKLV